MANSLLSLTDEGESCQNCEFFNVANMSLHHFPGNKILAKNFDFTVVLVQPRKYLYHLISTGLTHST